MNVNHWHIRARDVGFMIDVYQLRLQFQWEFFAEPATKYAAFALYLYSIRLFDALATVSAYSGCIFHVPGR